MKIVKTIIQNLLSGKRIVAVFIACQYVDYEKLFQSSYLECIYEQL